MLIRPEGHREPRNEVGSQRPVSFQKNLGMACDEHISTAFSGVSIVEQVNSGMRGFVHIYQKSHE